MRRQTSLNAQKELLSGFSVQSACHSGALCYREGEKRQQQLSHGVDGVLWGQWFPAPAKKPKATEFGLLLRQD